MDARQRIDRGGAGLEQRVVVVARGRPFGGLVVKVAELEEQMRASGVGGVGAQACACGAFAILEPVRAQRPDAFPDVSVDGAERNRAFEQGRRQPWLVEVNERELGSADQERTRFLGWPRARVACELPHELVPLLRPLERGDIEPARRRHLFEELDRVGDRVAFEEQLGQKALIGVARRAALDDTAQRFFGFARVAIGARRGRQGARGFEVEAARRVVDALGRFRFGERARVRLMGSGDLAA